VTLPVGPADEAMAAVSDIVPPTTAGRDATPTKLTDDAAPGTGLGTLPKPMAAGM